MGVFTFVCRSSGDNWSAKQLKGDLQASAGSTYELQRKLVQVAQSEDSSGGVSSSFSYVTPSSAVFQVIVGGGAALIAGGVAAVGGAPAGGAPAAEAPPAEDKNEVEEESEGDMGFSLFD